MDAPGAIRSAQRNRLRRTQPPARVLGSEAALTPQAANEPASAISSAWVRASASVRARCPRGPASAGGGAVERVELGGINSAGCRVGRRRLHLVVTALTTSAARRSCLSRRSRRRRLSVVAPHRPRVRPERRRRKAAQAGSVHRCPSAAWGLRWRSACCTPPRESPTAPGITRNGKPCRCSSRIHCHAHGALQGLLVSSRIRCMRPAHPLTCDAGNGNGLLANPGEGVPWQGGAEPWGPRHEWGLPPRGLSACFVIGVYA